MQDITPPHQIPRGRIRPEARPVAFDARAARRVMSQRTTVVNDVVTHQPIFETVETIETIIEPTPSVRPIESLSPEAKAQALENALRMTQRQLRFQKLRNRDMKRFGLIFIASVFVLVTGYVAIDTWMTNQQVKAGTVSGEVVGTPTPEQEGKDETVVTPASLSAYTVAPDLPRALYIKKLGVAARILPMSVNSDGAIQSPRNIFDAGWYNASVKPGDIGAVFIDGHASGPTRQGLFGNLDELVAGDELQVEKGDGSRLNYRVVATETVELASLDMKRALLPQNGVLRGLNLMTCTGEWIDSEQTFDHRVIVYTEQI